MTLLDQLLDAKAQSDRGHYQTKHMLLRAAIASRPDEFEVDSDDGRGIVGVTHRPTGFKFHMPKQRVPVSMKSAKPALEKGAGLAQMLQAAKSVGDRVDLTGAGMRAAKSMVDVFERKPQLEAAFRKLTSYNVVDPRNRGKNTAAGALTGVLPGAVVGATTSDESGAGGLKGALAGALAGAAGGRYGPRAVQAGLGRVLTNVVDPHIYDGAMHAGVFKDLVKEHGAAGILKSIWNDKPLVEIAPVRHALFRDFFGLKRFPGTDDAVIDVARGADGGKLSQLNPGSEAGLKELKAVDKARRDSLYFDRHNPGRHMKAGEPTLTNAGAMGNFVVQPDGKWSDSWDFALNGGEKVNSVERLLQALVTPFGTPTTLRGRTLSQGEVLRRSDPAGRFDLIHESFTTPVLNRGIRGSGADPTEFMRYVKGEINRGDGAAFMSALADRAEGKPYNLLHSLAQAENIPPGDLRVMLGGTKKPAVQRGGPPKFPVGDLTKMYGSRVAGSTPQAVHDAISSLSPSDLRMLQNKLRDWSAAGRPRGGELRALADVLGFATDELPVLLQ